MKRLLTTSLLAATLIAVPSVGDSTSPRPETPLISIADGQPVRMTYELRANAWAFIIPISGRANFSAELYPDNYRITSQVRTTGLADILVNYDLGLSSTGYVDADRLRPYAYISQNADGKKNRRVELTWGAGDVAATINPAFGDLGHPPARPDQKIEALDPITALINFALEPRDVEADPCGGPLRIFDGRQLSHLHLEYAGMRNVRSDAWRGEAIECHVTLEKVAGFKEDSEPGEDNLAGINGPLRMFLAPLPNGATVPVRIEAETEDIGRVVLQAARLSFEPITTDQASTGRRGG